MLRQQPGNADGNDDEDAKIKTSASNWESEYAEMNALAVLYFKALATCLSTSTAGSNATSAECVTTKPSCTIQNNGNGNNHGNEANDVYIGIVSPGMTYESLKIAHVHGRRGGGVVGAGIAERSNRTRRWPRPWPWRCGQ